MIDFTLGVMMKDLSVCDLYDIYGGLLTDKQSKFIRSFYEEDLSLGEIAELEGVTRQAAHDAITKGVASLRNYEATLKLNRTLRRLEKIDGSMSKEKILSEISDILKDRE